MINVAGPSITNHEIMCVQEAVTNGWYENNSNFLKDFENKFSNYVGRKYAIAVPSCTSGIHLSLLAHGITNGDEVIVPELTWIGTVAPVTYCGATPVFVDVFKDNFCIDLESIRQRITSRTRVIIAVNLYGDMADWDGLVNLAQEKGILLIEDSAQSIGSKFKSKLSGSFGSISVFSFHGTKTLTTGEGGMVLTDDNDLYHRMRFLADHGKDSSKLFWNLEVGLKCKMSNIQAALGSAQLDRIEVLISKKRSIHVWYQNYLKANNYKLVGESSGVFSTYWMNTIILDDDRRRDELMEFLKENEVQTRPVFYPLSSLPAFQFLSESIDHSMCNPNAYEISKKGINLPSALNLEEVHIATVASLIDGFFNNSKKIIC